MSYMEISSEFNVDEFSSEIDSFYFGNKPEIKYLCENVNKKKMSLSDFIKKRKEIYI